jgi:hypothetical protein
LAVGVFIKHSIEKHFCFGGFTAVQKPFGLNLRRNFLNGLNNAAGKWGASFI